MLSKTDWTVDNYWVDYCYTLDPIDLYDGKKVNSQTVLMA